ncbi:MAG: heparinase II/III family protein [Bryobacterales bacterium]|nr:heparinase II/III family protein [Bryobacterales bacterium]
MRPVSLLFLAFAASSLIAEKTESVFYPRAVRERAVRNATQFRWAAEIQQKAIADADRWLHISDDDLWQDMFGPRITRSHMVWSAGYCPACRKPVPMYDWKIDAWKTPWKARCPHCNELFPKNDFEAFYKSGIDSAGIFDPKKADRKLLYNLEHPNPNDPLHLFGVDDGEGYVEGNKRWRFIGAYLLYGQWTQRIESGVRNLATAYTMTGDKRYAHKAGVLLDRIADIWPTFDYATQGLVYERARYGGGVAGYVWYAITSAYTVMYLTTAYDQVFDGIKDDKQLVEFLRTKSAAKRTFADIRKNIEDNILRHALANPHQIRTNYPGRERALMLIQTVLGWPGYRTQLRAEMDKIIAKAVEVDGLSGEKGLAGYSSIAPRDIAEIMEEYAALDPGLVPYLVDTHPKLKQTYKFHFDTWIDHSYYIHSGDSGSFSKKSERYAGLVFGGSVYSLLPRLAKATGDPMYLQMAWIGNGKKLDGLPHNIFAEDPAGYATQVKQAVDKYGTWPKVASVNKEEWRMAVLRHRTAPDAAVFLDYDSVPECQLKSHYHFDAMNIGMFAKGLDLLPEFGYPAVQFGDWHTPQAIWHRKTAAHNTVVVDGKDQSGGPTQCTLWTAGGEVQAVRANSPSQIKGQVYERTVAMVETGPADYYVLDVFRVTGGLEHAKHTHTNYAKAVPFGVKLAAADSPYAAGTLMRAFQLDRTPQAAWGVDWQIVDRYNYAPGRKVHLRYTDLTRDSEAMTAESWTVESTAATKDEWIPTVVTRRKIETGDLSSTFVGVFEPYEGQSRVSQIKRIDAEGSDAVKIQVNLQGGLVDQLSSHAAGLKWERRNARGAVMFSGEAKSR